MGKATITQAATIPSGVAATRTGQELFELRRQAAIEALGHQIAMLAEEHLGEELRVTVAEHRDRATLRPMGKAEFEVERTTYRADVSWIEA